MYQLEFISAKTVGSRFENFILFFFMHVTFITMFFEFLRKLFKEKSRLKQEAVKIYSILNEL